MKIRPLPLLSFLLLGPLALLLGCGKKTATTADGHDHSAAKHEHAAPHGGTPVVLGDEAYHLELVLDPAAGKLQAFIFDGHFENFIRTALPTLDVTATVNGQPAMLVLKAVANPATGETVGDTSLFEGQADWLKTTKSFDAVLKTVTIKGTEFKDVKFNYPKGNEAHD